MFNLYTLCITISFTCASTLEYNSSTSVSLNITQYFHVVIHTTELIFSYMCFEQSSCIWKINISVGQFLILLGKWYIFHFYIDGKSAVLLSTRWHLVTGLPYKYYLLLVCVIVFINQALASTACFESSPTNLYNIYNDLVTAFYI